MLTTAQRRLNKLLEASELEQQQLSKEKGIEDDKEKDNRIIKLLYACEELRNASQTVTGTLEAFQQTHSEEIENQRKANVSEKTKSLELKQQELQSHLSKNAGLTGFFRKLPLLMTGRANSIQNTTERLQREINEGKNSLSLAEQSLNSFYEEKSSLEKIEGKNIQQKNVEAQKLIERFEAQYPAFKANENFEPPLVLTTNIPFFSGRMIKNNKDLKELVESYRYYEGAVFKLFEKIGSPEGKMLLQKSDEERKATLEEILANKVKPSVEEEKKEVILREKLGDLRKEIKDTEKEIAENKNKLIALKKEIETREIRSKVSGLPTSIVEVIKGQIVALENTFEAESIQIEKMNIEKEKKISKLKEEIDALDKLISKEAQKEDQKATFVRKMNIQRREIANLQKELEELKTQKPDAVKEKNLELKIEDAKKQIEDDTTIEELRGQIFQLNDAGLT